MFCARCGTGMSDDAGFCPSCGAPVQRNQPAPPPVYQAPPPPPVYQAPPPPPRPVYQAPPPPPVYQAPPPQPPQNWQPQQQPPQAWPPPPQGVMAPQLPYAGFWKRWVAYSIIDGLILSAGAVVVLGVVFLMIGGGAVLSGDKSIDNFMGDMAAVAVLLLVVTVIGLIVGVWLYFAKMESSASQATIGKRVMGVYVTDLQGQRLTFGRASGRFFSKIITYMIPLAIGWIMAGFTEKKQALHDMIAGTLVMRRG